MRALVAILAACSSGASMSLEQQGKLAFEDTSLSQPVGQACADCHAQAVAFRDPESEFSTSQGAVSGRFGPRNAPTAMYARYIPPLRFDANTQRFIGGLFWDGRASTLEEQAKAPLQNPLEMNNPGAVSDHLVASIAAYERTDVFAPFSSKYDRYLAGSDTLDESEQRGLAIFEDPARGNCASCHPSRPGADGSPPLFTDFSYANLGIPTYANSKYLTQPPDLNPDGLAFVDHGLMLTVGDPAQDGKFRVPTLRNVGRTAPYGHNGYFENLPYLLDFLNTRDAGGWSPPEIPANVDMHVGHLGLSAQDLQDLDAFLATLSDE